MSGLTPQTVEVRLGKRDSKTSPLLTTPGTLLRAENVVMDSVGELRRRPGGSLVVASAVSGTEQQLAQLSGELLVVTTDDSNQTMRVGGMDPALSASFTTRVSANRPLRTGPAVSAAIRGDQRCHDFVRAGGCDWHVYETKQLSSGTDLNAVVLDVYDSTTRAKVNSINVAASTGPFPTRPSIYVVGTNILVVYALVTTSGNNETTAGNLIARKIPVSTPTASIGGAVTVDAMWTGQDVNGLAAAYDCQLLTGSSTIIGFVYKVAGAVSGSRVRIREWDVSTMATAFTSNGADIATTANGDVGDTAFGFLKHTHSDSKWYAASVASCTAAGRNAVALHTCATSTSGAVTDTIISVSLNPYGTGAEGFRNVTGYVVTSTLTQHIFVEGRSDGPNWPTPTANGRTGGDKYINWFQRTSGGVITNPSGGFTWGFGLGSRPWSVTGTIADQRMRILLTYTSSICPTYFVAVIDSVPQSSGIIARAFPGSAGIVDGDVLEKGTNSRIYRPQRSSRLPDPQISGSTVTIAALRMGASSTVSSPQREAYLLSFLPCDYRQPAVNAAGEVVFPGGRPHTYLGDIFSGGFGGTGSLCELGFSLSPEAPQNLVGAAGGSLTASATYQYAYLYIYKDLQGRAHFSSPSPVASITLTAGQTKVTLDVPAYKVLERPVTILVFRSTANPGAGAPLFFVGSVDNQVGTPTQRVQTFTDDGLNFQAGEELYTKNGAVLENAPWPNLSRLTVWKNRLWGLLEENLSAFCYSKLLKPDFGPEFNDDFQGVIEDQYGQLYGFSPLGERFVFFKKDAVYYITGEGPGDDGIGSFSEPLRIDGVPGCSNPDSILLTDQGVMYQAPDMGLWLLTLSLESKFLGRSVADATKTAGAITGSLFEPQQRHARFFNSATGTTFVYDLQNDFWYTFTGQSVLSAIMFNGQQHYLVSNNILKEEALAGSVFTENGATYQSVIELAWLALGSLSGYMRTWVVAILGRLFGAHTLTLEMVADYGTSITSRALASSAVITAHGYRIEADVPLQMQQNTSVKLLIKDDSPNTAGWGIDAVTLQCGFAPGRRPRLPAAHTMG